jgi:hypothetical protein
VWIELHQSLPRHPKLFRLAKELKVEPPIAFWHLCNLWLWALDYAPSGDLTGMTDTEMAAAANWSGDPNNFIRGLCTCGWLDPGPRIHDWELYAGKLFERKEANRLKAQRFRKRNRDVTDTSPLRNGVRNQKVTEIVPSERTVEDSTVPTVQNKQITTPAPTAAPASVAAHDLFISAWKGLPETFPKIAVWTKKRATAFKERIKDPHFRDNWAAGLERMKSSLFCQGHNDRGWKADIDFFLRPDTLAKILEGKYDRNGGGVLHTNGKPVKPTITCLPDGRSSFNGQIYDTPDKAGEARKIFWETHNKSDYRMPDDATDADKLGWLLECGEASIS